MENTSTFSERSNDFFRKPYSITGIFAVALLLFLLPFVQFKCASVKVAENTGIGIATGAPWKISMYWGNNAISEKMRDSVKRDESLLRTRPNIFAVAALVIGALGIAFSLLRSEWRSITSMCAGILGAIMLIALMIQIKILMRSSNIGGIDEVDMALSGVIRVHFTIWYFLSLFGFASAGYLGYKHSRVELNEKLKGARDFEFEKRE